MSSTCVWLLMLMPVSPVAVEPQQNPPAPGQPQEAPRRCAYLGYWGSFHLIATGGSAAYHLNADRFVADLTFVREDDAFWYYRPANGDPFTTMWAFSRQRDCFGMNWVWRGDLGGWYPYEATRAWGAGLDRVQTSVTTSDGRIERLEESVSDLKTRVRNLEKPK
jgi:hypothetical protein